jgi:lipid-binding SYLF domain-containing protein
MKIIASTALLGLLVSLCVVGCSTVPEKEADRDRLDADVEAAIKSMTTEDPTLRALLDHSAGYAVFPSVGKGGFGVGGAYGRGHVFDEDRWIGYSDLKQGTIGAQAGGQTYHELIVFQDEAALNRFKTGQYALSANASAVALKGGAAKGANFKDGVVVFVRPEGGLMFEASIGGQKFSFVPVSSDRTVERTTSTGTETKTTVEDDGNVKVDVDAKPE